MQMIIAQTAMTFVDDAVALSKGSVALAQHLTVELFTATRRRVMGPVDRLAQACDVAGVLSARQAAMTRSRVERMGSQRNSAAPRRRKRGSVCDVFHGLRDLT